MDRNDNSVDALVRRGIQQQVEIIGSPGSLALRSRERSARRRRRQVAGVCLGVLAAAALVPLSLTYLESNDVSPAASGTPGPVIRSEPRGDGEVRMTAEIRGPLDLTKGCLSVDEYLTVWPAETSWDAAKQELILPEAGVRLRLGATFEGGGGYLDPSVLGPENFVSAADYDRYQACVQSLRPTEIAIVNDVS
jgi:hypothetical protein